jgi:hypothetical protein
VQHVEDACNNMSINNKSALSCHIYLTEQKGNTRYISWNKIATHGKSHSLHWRCILCDLDFVLELFIKIRNVGSCLFITKQPPMRRSSASWVCAYPH